MRRLRDLVDELLHAQVKTKLFGGEHAPTLGRLVLKQRLGAGAMGTVFAAYDPRLDRNVAVKVLRSADDATRVLAEARALARLGHPNVVAVHDADELDGVVYIVMELADGKTLRAWLAEPHTWRDVLRVMRDAAAGIAAAHAAGLVHRDVKPDNILVGADRARVVDFGLAAPHDETGRAGTPTYMAPEVAAGGAATAASDQYSYGKTFEEALGPEAPAWLRAVIERAVAPAPAARFSSMTELAEALREPRRRRWLWLSVPIAVVAIGGGALALRGKTDPCSGGAERVQTVWNEDARVHLRAALATAPWLKETLARFEDQASSWQLAYRRVCEATRVRGDQSDTLLDLRMRCLDRELERFAALVSAIPTATEASARAAAPTAIGELDTAHCETIREPGELAMPTDAGERARVQTAERALDRAWAQFVLGRYKQARDVLPPADAPAPRVRAEILALASSIEARVGDATAARKLLDDALVAAADAKAPELELAVWSRRLRNELFAGDPAKVIELATIARAAARRAGRDGADLDGIVAQALRNVGKLDEARTLLDKALASKDPLRADQRALLEMNRGSIDLAAGDTKAALSRFTSARDAVLDSLGDHHPDLAIYEDKLAAAKRARGLIREALKLHDHSIELRVAAFGEDDRAVATGLLYRAQTKLEAGDVIGARNDLLKAKRIREQAFGATSPRLAEIDTALADVEIAVGHATYEPRPELVAPLAVHETLSIERANALAAHVKQLVTAGKPDDAKTLAEMLRARFRAELDPALGTAIGEALLAVGDRTGAATVLRASAATLSNEPSRTALRLFVALAKATDDPAAARVAVSLYQAMPALDRADYTAMWELSRRAPAPSQQ